MGTFINDTGRHVYLWSEGKWIDISDAMDRYIEELADEISDEEIPFCDMDCDDCPETDQLDGYEIVDEDDIDVGLWEGDDPPFWGIPDINHIVFSDPATIVFWDDGTKTVVKTCDGDKFERYMGFAVACMKKMFGSTSRAKKIMNELAVDQVVDRKHKDSGYVPDLNSALTKVIEKREEENETPSE